MQRRGELRGGMPQQQGRTQVLLRSLHLPPHPAACISARGRALRARLQVIAGAPQTTMWHHLPLLRQRRRHRFSRRCNRPRPVHFTPRWRPPALRRRPKWSFRAALSLIQSPRISSSMARPSRSLLCAPCSSNSAQRRAWSRSCQSRVLAGAFSLVWIRGGPFFGFIGDEPHSRRSTPTGANLSSTLFTRAHVLFFPVLRSVVFPFPALGASRINYLKPSKTKSSRTNVHPSQTAAGCIEEKEGTATVEPPFQKSNAVAPQTQIRPTTRRRPFDLTTEIIARRGGGDEGRDVVLDGRCGGG